MKNRIGPLVKHVWNAVFHVLHIFEGLVINTKTFYLGQYGPSSPSTIKLNGLTKVLAWRPY